MADLDLTIDQKQYQRLMTKLNSLKPQDRLSVVNKAMLHAVNLVERKLKLNLTGQILNVRTGKLRQSIGSRVFFSDTGITGLVGSGVRTGKRMIYANIHETGGTIVPKRKKWLTIPLDAAKTRSGAPRRAKALDWKDTFIIRTKSGQLLIVRKDGKKKLTPLYVLKKSVKIPKRRYLSKTMQQMEKRVLIVLGAHIEKGLQNV